MEKLILTRRIQLVIPCRDKEELKVYYDRLYDFQRSTCKAANMINTHLFVQDRLKEMVYLVEEKKVALADASKSEEGILNTSRMNSTYRQLSAHFLKILPSNTLSNLNQAVFKTYQANKDLYWKGEKSLPNYRKDLPIPFSSRELRLEDSEDGKNYLFQLFKIPFKTYLGRDKAQMRHLLKRVQKGEISLRQSALQLKNNKIYLLASVEVEKQETPLDASLIAEVSLSLEFPLVVRIGKNELQIGSKEEFLYRRLAIQAARRRVQHACSYSTGGRGRAARYKSLENFSEKEKNYIDEKLHLYSRRLIDYCLKESAGTILLVNQSYKEEMAKEDRLLLRNWSYYGLKEKIAYKAKQVGINVLEE